jgi:hypothetical protein
MQYPTLEQVELASTFQLCEWTRFLHSPGGKALDSPNFHQILESEGKVMDRICARLKDLGGFTPEISKKLGWKS